MRPNSRTQLHGKINAFLIFLVGHLTQPRIGRGSSNAVVLGGEKYEILATTIDQYRRDAATGSSRVFTVLQRSMREGLQPYETRTFALLFLAATRLRITLVGSIRIASHHAVGAQAGPCGETARVRGKSHAARKFQRLGVTN